MARATSRKEAEDTAAEPDRIPGHPHPRETSLLYGQDPAEHRFLDAWQNGRLHHAWLLRGPEGVGKATLAYRIARALIAADATTGVPKTLDPPEVCPSRQRILAQSEPRLFILRRSEDDKGRLRTVITVDDVRRLRRFLGLSAADGGWRVVIIDSADEMNRNAANALLKFLEEPPAATIFLLISHSPSGLLPTIRSRCRMLDFRPLGAEDLARALSDSGAELRPGQEVALAELSGGSTGRALRLLTGEGLALYARLVALFDTGHRNRGRIARGPMTDLAEGISGRANAEKYRLLLDLVQILVARLARAAATGTSPPEAAPGEAALIANLAHEPAQATLWAEALGTIASTTHHAVAVNLDPAQTVLNTLLEIDAIIGRARAVA